MKKKALSVAMTVSILVLMLISVRLTLAKAGYLSEYLGEVPPDKNTKPPKILISSPENNTEYCSGNIFFSLNVSLEEAPTALGWGMNYIYYRTDWQNNITLLYDTQEVSSDNRISWLHKTCFTHFQNLTGIPEGKHSITVYANESGTYPGNHVGWASYYDFRVSSRSTVFFTTDTIPPNVAVLTLENKTHGSSDVPLNFAVNEPFLQVTYSLDGQDKITIVGNTTLTSLTSGKHSLKLYVKDLAGNIGTSDTIYFTVEPFPTIWVAVAAVASVTIAAVGLLVYLRKRKR